MKLMQGDAGAKRNWKHTVIMTIFFLSGLMINITNTLAADIPSNIEFKGETYQLLNDEELAATISNTSIQTDPQSYITEYFNKGGAYRASGDRGGLKLGKYSVSNNQVCIHYTNPSFPMRCNALFKNSQNEYVGINLSLMNGTKKPYKVFIKPLNE